ncbi:hypothetical protein DdX_21352 [Ditylenchus destructor]|uniref:Uncharacterized protein n=1 Tax=Ditylenchus destructor TaxID=166010 RepID=A0AAD4MJS2_9BILA|nr:hypothetical protein DdX_21352 [Ditylenchus destructor]
MTPKRIELETSGLQAKPEATRPYQLFDGVAREDFTFTGEVSIDFVVLNATNKIVLSSKNLSLPNDPNDVILKAIAVEDKSTEDDYFQLVSFSLLRSAGELTAD